MHNHDCTYDPTNGVDVCDYIPMYIRYVPTEYRGLIERDTRYKVTKIRFIPSWNHEIITKAFNSINRWI